MFYCFDATVNGVIFFSFQVFCYWCYVNMGLPRWLCGKESACNAGDTGDTGSIFGSGRSPRGGNGYPLQYSCLKILWTEEPAGYNPWGHRVRHDWACMHANINATDSVYWFYIHTFYQCVVYFPISMSLTSIFSFQLQRTPFSVSCKASVVDSLGFCFSGKVFLLHISGVS